MVSLVVNTQLPSPHVLFTRKCLCNALFSWETGKPLPLPIHSPFLTRRPRSPQLELLFHKDLLEGADGKNGSFVARKKLHWMPKQVHTRKHQRCGEIVFFKCKHVADIYMPFQNKILKVPQVGFAGNSSLGFAPFCSALQRSSSKLLPHLLWKAFSVLPEQPRAH